MSQSIFAHALQQLFDGTGLFSRREWEQICGASSGSVERWLTDKALPGSNHLSMVLDCLEGSDVPNAEVLAFKSLFEKSFREISPIAEDAPIVGADFPVGEGRVSRKIGSMTLGQYIAWFPFRKDTKLSPFIPQGE